MTDFSVLLEDYFCKHLPVERGCSINTIRTYRDAFVELFEYLHNEKGILPDQINMELFDFNQINDFLNWLEAEKKVSVSTRNNRLAGIKSFFRYVSFHEPAFLNRCSMVLAIKAKKTESVPMSYLTVGAWELFMKSFDLENPRDLRDFCIIVTLYESGARVSELTAVLCGEVRLESPCTIILHGKGRKTRIVPLDPSVASLLKRYIQMRGIPDNASLFTNRHGNPLTRKGVNYILQKHFKKVKAVDSTMFPDKISPHSLRHSKAMHLLENDVNLIYIRDFLGHASVTTTEIYSKANPEIKRKHLEEATKRVIDHEDYDDRKKEDLLNWLKKNF